jgi:hypothetical protein
MGTGEAGVRGVNIAPTVAKLCIQYIFPFEKKLGLPLWTILKLIEPRAVRILAELLVEGHIDMRTARASITYMVTGK